MNLFRRNDLIERLCRRSGKWEIRRHNGDIYMLHARDERAGQLIRVRYSPGYMLLFESELPVRFSLASPPAGLFARVLMRSVSLKLASWRMDIRESCEAMLYLSAQLSDEGMAGWLLDKVCREMRDEVLSFHQELRDKFLYDTGAAMQGGAAVTRPDALAGRYDQIAANLLANADRYRMLRRPEG